MGDDSADLPVSGDDSTATVQPPPQRPRTIGDYRILRPIGEGGMGVVYEAEQQNPRRVVALKVVRGGAYLDEQAIRLFRREAQVLARLKHPGIAAIYESGRTEDGQHFFAMEFVRGETLGAYVRRRAGAKAALTPLELRERLALFRKICDAVSYAHQRGVIHRDLKPSNVLVTSETPEGVPDIKILDFGLARITDSDVAMSTILTEAGRVMGTLPYMSPEQVRGHADEIDFRSDVYSLGVILYELVSGQLPHDVVRLALPEAMRVICEEPPQPLTRAYSGTRRLDTDLGTIVQKALEKDPARRYQGAAALSEDLQRYLTDQPILARPPSALYQFRKLVARHRAPFAFVATLFMVLLGFAVTMTVQAGRIARERDRANLERERANREAGTAKTVSEFLVGLFQVADPGETRGRTITAKEILDAGAAKIERELQGEPLMQASLMATMGRVYFNLGLYDRSGLLLEKALAIRQESLGEDHAEVADVLNLLGRTRLIQGQYAGSLSHHRRALEIQKRALPEGDAAIGWTYYYLGAVRVNSGDLVGAKEDLETALSILERRLGPDSVGVAWCVNDLGKIREQAGDYPEAERMWERALRIKEKLLPADHPDIAIALNNLGIVKARMGDFGAAREMLERALRVSEKALGGRHYQVGVVSWSLGEMWSLQGHFETARPYLERALAIEEKILEPDNPDLSDAYHSLGVVLQNLGELPSAERMFERALAIREKIGGKGDMRLADTLEEYARLLRRSGRPAEAERLETRARAFRTQNRPD